MKEVTTSFGAWLRRQRLDRGWSQVELARRSGMQQRTISDMESGPPTRHVAIDMAVKVCRALNIPINEALAAMGSQDLSTTARGSGDLSADEREFIRRMRSLGLTGAELRALAKLLEKLKDKK